jgi:type IV secretion system protein VirB10
MPSYLITRVSAVLALVFVSPLAAAPDPERDFSGVWILDEHQSDLRGLPAAPAALLNITQQEEVIRCMEGAEGGNSSATWIYRTDGEAAKFQIGNLRMNGMSKWEGAALVTNTIVSGSQNYTVNDRWRLSRDHNVLTIKRQIQRPSGETEAVLVYRNRNAKQPDVNQPAVNQQATPASGDHTPPADEITVPAGTKIPLALINSLNTKRSAEGDRVYLQTSFPVMIGGRIIIPRGSYVAGTVTEVKRPGKVKGKGEIYLRFDSLTLPNGVTRDFRARLGGSDTGDFDRQEGKIRGEGDKAGDARRVGETTAAGAGVGTVAGAAAGHAGMGAGIGAAAGAAAGLASVLLSRGPDLILPKGTSFEMVLDRGLKYIPSELGQ